MGVMHPRQIWQRDSFRIILPSVMSISLFIVVIFLFLLPAMKGHIMEDKREMIREIAQLAWDTVAHLDDKVKAGKLSLQEAQNQAKESLRAMLYGKGSNDYIWINDMQSHMVMHPYRPDLEGQDISGLVDSNGKRFVAEFVQVVKERGQGYVSYLWQWKDDPARIEPKLSFVKGFKPWGWIIGTGIYLEDVREEVASMTREFTSLSLGVLGIITCLLLYVIRQGLIFEERRKTAETALRESEARFRKLAEDAPFALSIMRPDKTFEYFNPKFREIFQYDINDIPDKETWFKKAYPDEGYRAAVRAVWQQDSEEIETDKVIRERTFTVRSKDGQEKIIHFRNVTLEDGRQFMTYEDVTARTKSEAMLRENERELKSLYEKSKRNEELYRSLIRSSADAIVIYDLEGKARYVSPAFTQMFGWDYAEVRDKRIPFLPESEKEATMSIIKGIVQDGTPCRGFETKRFTRDGRLVDVSISASRYDDHEGKPTGILVILRDISERKKLQAQLQQAQKMEAIGTLAGGIAHDFNNLLMGIQGNVSLMLLNVSEDDASCGRLKVIEKQIRNGSKLTGQLLGYARQGRYEIRTLDVNEVVRETADTFGRTNRQITVHQDLAEALYSVQADRSQIEQVLFNLFVNAWQAMPGGGDLFVKTANTRHEEMQEKVYTAKPGKYVLLEVTDTGVGMDEKTLERIFEPFFTTKEMGHGTGLGLASVYGIVKGHGGYIDVASTKGQGTNFKIYLPASGGVVAQMGDKMENVRKGKETVLLVDDEDTILTVGQELLEAMGYTAHVARSGEEAVEIYTRHREAIDLVLLDMVMPEMGGGETFNYLKKINPNIKVLLSSGYSLNGEAKEIFDRGCKGFIQKPFRLKDLSNAIRGILDS